MTVKLLRTRYPDFLTPSYPCWQVHGRRIEIDADWNTRWPFGISISVSLGVPPPRPPHTPQCKTDCRCEWPPDHRAGFSLDLNAPLGEPNRIGISGRRRHWMVGLIQWRSEIDGPGTRPHVVRAQRYDWKHSQWMAHDAPRAWRWIVSSPRPRR